MAVVGLAAADHGALEYIQGGEQGRRAVAHVVMRPRLRAPGTHKWRRSRAVQCLDLALLVDTQHQGLGGGIQVQPHHVAQLLHELRITTQLERRYPVRVQPVRFPGASCNSPPMPASW